MMSAYSKRLIQPRLKRRPPVDLDRDDSDLDRVVAYGGNGEAKKVTVKGTSDDDM